MQWMLVAAILSDLVLRALAWRFPSGTATPEAAVAVAQLLSVATFPLLGIGMGRGLIGRIDQRLRNPWPLRLAFLAAGCAMVDVVFRSGGAFLVGTDGIVVHWTYEPFVVGFDLILTAVFPAVADVLSVVTRRIASIMTKFVIVGMLATAISLALAAVVPRIGLLPVTTGPVYFAVLFLAVSTIVYGFCVSFADGLTRWFDDARVRLDAFGRGESVALDESPRDETGVFARAFNKAMADRAEASFLEQAFGRYVAPDVLDALRRKRDGTADGGVTLDSRRVDATVLYADIRGFTRFSESETPEEVMRVLNVYFERMIDVIAAHSGYINKFIGDAVMVVFGAPVEQPDHAARALACAKAMQVALVAMNDAGAFGASRRVEIGIGVNSGPLVAGSLGSERRAEYTVIGDTVNVAARLTSSAKPGEILVGATTAKAADAGDLEPQPPLTVKGKSQPLEVFRVGAAAQAAQA